MTGGARVLVTNVDTPLGAAVVQDLLREPAIERVIGWRSQRAADACQDPRLTYEQLDAHHDRELWRALFGAAREQGIDCVIHDPIAMVTGHEPSLDWDKATEESRRLLLHCAEHPTIRRFVLRSSLEVYRVAANLPLLIQEDHPLDMAASSRRVRGMVESDLYACSRATEQGLQITVARCAELLGSDVGSGLFDYLCAPVCLRPLGFDPMLNLLSVADAAQALVACVLREAHGVFNIPGKDVLPLSRLIALAGRRQLAVPGTLLAPLYWFRARTTHAEFRYAGYASRFHHSGIPDGRRAASVLGYRPQHALDFARLAADVRARIRRAWPTPELKRGPRGARGLDDG